MRRDCILITGANGQIGSVLTQALQYKFGVRQIIPTDIRPPKHELPNFEILDITEKERLLTLVKKYKVTQIYHLAAILSAKGESNPQWAWQLNMSGLMNVLEVARSEKLDKVFFPSSIAVFGTHAPQTHTPQQSVLNPSTVYGISKMVGEQWCNYYFQKYDLDVRSVRYPGIIGYQSMPGGGTTDYAVDIFHYAVKHQPYTCFLSADTRLPMMYMDDAIRATLELMQAPKENIHIRTSYNLAGVSFTPAELTQAIQHEMPGFKIHYQPDFRQAIADSWPQSLDDSQARKDWHWQEQFDIEKMTKEMLLQLKLKYMNPIRKVG